jgi:hypothetical protein
MVLDNQAWRWFWGGDQSLRMDSLARDYLRRAEARLVSARYAFDQGYYPEVVRYFQGCVELSLKACLRFVGIECPKVHNVGDYGRNPPLDRHHNAPQNLCWNTIRDIDLLNIHQLNKGLTLPTRHRMLLKGSFSTLPRTRKKSIANGS